MRFLDVRILGVMGAVLIVSSVAMATNRPTPSMSPTGPVPPAIQFVSDELDQKPPPSFGPNPDRGNSFDKLGQSVEKGAKGVGTAVSSGAKDVGHAVESSAKTFGRAVTDGWRSFKRTLAGDR